jgi:hypothetical protein
MWNLWKKKYEKISFEDVQFAIQHVPDFIVINTLPTNEQKCLIRNTTPYQNEEGIINEHIQQYNYKSPKFIIYGKNTNDPSVERKCEQLLNLGFIHVYIYLGGMFEWLTLQDIYGKDEFPTTSNVLDILKYKPSRKFGGSLITI